MIHPDTQLQFISEEAGHGVVAVKPIPRGTITWVKDPLDCTFSPAAVDRMPAACRKALDHFCYRDRKGDYALCWDHARFINHSFRPNCIATAYDFELAVRDIAAGEELVNDYGFLNILEPFRPRDEGTRRKVVYPDDLRRCHRHWDRLLKTAFKALPAVEQPLKPLFSAARWRVAQDVAMGRTGIKSILHNLVQA